MPSDKVIRLDCAAFGLHCHPSEPLFASGLIDGSVNLYRYGEDDVTVAHTWNLHKKASRAVTFIQEGQAIVSASAACAFRVVDVESQQLVHTQKKAHTSPAYSLYSVSNWIMASGDEDGMVKLWDTRQWPKPVMEVSECADRISDLASYGTHNALLATSGDGTLSVFNFRKRKLIKQSDPNECDLNCVSILKNGKKVACGTGAGTIHVYSWSEWGDISDRCRLRGAGIESVDASVAVNDSQMCVACDDGTIRLVQIHPNKNLGIVGKHDDGESVERLGMTHDSRYIVSASLDETLRLWDIQEHIAILGEASDSDEDDDDDDDDDDEDDDDDSGSGTDDGSDGSSGSDSDTKAAAGKATTAKAKSNSNGGNSQGSCDDDDDDDDSDGAGEESDSSNAGASAVPPPPAKRKALPKKQPAAKRNKSAGKNNFFADL